MSDRQELAAEIAMTCAVFAAFFTLGIIGISFINWLGEGYGFSIQATKYLAYMWSIQLGAIPIALDILLKAQHKS